MKVLIACEFSGVVREAFRQKGHDAWSCDILPSEIPSYYHTREDVMKVVYDEWDMMIAHPPCTYLAVSGARWFKERQSEQVQALDFVSLLMNAPIKKICIENPVSIISSKIRKPDQIIQPYQFGHGETKKTCLWLKNLPLLQHTSNNYDWKKLDYHNIVNGRKDRIHKMPPSENRGKERSRTYQGIAEAMATQWG